ncbi:hypothetical protein Enr13x_31960 [Stieleria neptunia]|uniref:Uncharacterized protein n=1 Tax=Stieleria neptunia TaxID=2527979 RepID=A0A518HRB8_9BACT|nr:hypothetical protein [Stieleria neptunia]QDV43341.1 hypothetical protein Enr13x_31960 [Stieleria neptunia]
MKPDPNRSAGPRPRTVPPNDAKKKKQLALVAFLLTVLLIALVCSPSGEPPTGDAATSIKTSLVSLKPLDQQTPDGDQDELIERLVTAADLPTLTHDVITATDLFRGPAVEVVQSAPEPTPTQVEPPSTVQYNLGAVYGAYEGTDRKALIDGQIVRSGETLETGVVVIEVSDQGVEVAP